MPLHLQPAGVLEPVRRHKQTANNSAGALLAGKITKRSRHSEKCSLLIVFPSSPNCSPSFWAWVSSATGDTGLRGWRILGGAGISKSCKWIDGSMDLLPAQCLVLGYLHTKWIRRRIFRYANKRPLICAIVCTSSRVYFRELQDTKSYGACSISHFETKIPACSEFQKRRAESGKPQATRLVQASGSCSMAHWLWLRRPRRVQRRSWSALGIGQVQLRLFSSGPEAQAKTPDCKLRATATVVAASRPEDSGLQAATLLHKAESQNGPSGVLPIRLPGPLKTSTLLKHSSEMISTAPKPFPLQKNTGSWHIPLGGLGLKSIELSPIPPVVSTGSKWLDTADIELAPAISFRLWLGDWAH